VFFKLFLLLATVAIQTTTRAPFGAENICLLSRYWISAMHRWLAGLKSSDLATSKKRS
jgi:hypothetical protein